MLLNFIVFVEIEAPKGSNPLSLTVNLDEKSGKQLLVDVRFTIEVDNSLLEWRSLYRAI